MKKSDIETHGTNGPYHSRPAINIKTSGGYIPARKMLGIGYSIGGQDYADHLANLDAFPDWLWESACSAAWDMFVDDMRTLFGMPNMTWHTTGRSGGWAYSPDLPDSPENFSIQLLAKWGKATRIAKLYVDSIPESMLDLYYCNVYLPQVEENAANSQHVLNSHSGGL